MNTCKGIIRCPEVKRINDEELLRELSIKNNVTDVRRFKRRVDGQLVPTDTILLTFGTPQLPKKVLVAYMSKRVEAFIPNPLRCFRCQRFGHSQRTCQGIRRCGRCSETDHDDEICQNETHCANCGGEHLSRDKTCPIWKKEYEIQKKKVLEGISFKEARRLVELQQPVTIPEGSYADAAKQGKKHQQACQSCVMLRHKLNDMAEQLRLLQDQMAKMVASNSQNESMTISSQDPEETTYARKASSKPVGGNPPKKAATATSASKKESRPVMTTLGTVKGQQRISIYHKDNTGSTETSNKFHVLSQRDAAEMEVSETGRQPNTKKPESSKVAGPPKSGGVKPALNKDCKGKVRLNRQGAHPSKGSDDPMREHLTSVEGEIASTSMELAQNLQTKKQKGRGSTKH